MATTFQKKPPMWLFVVAVILVLWGGMGCYACYMQLTMGPEAWGDPKNIDYDRALYASLPSWYNIDYAIGVGTGLLGSLALLFRSALSRLLYVVSLVAIVIQFGYALLLTDLVAHKGAVATVPFPLLIIAIGVFEVWLSGYAKRRGWII
jgi:hypothetical protein